ncbi:MAG: nucleoside triphosphate pyrophosphohydrolase [Chloroflexota bacterium]
MTITIVGLGPGDPELLTRRAWRILGESKEVYLRTARHPGVEALPATTYHNFDDWYDRASDFDSLYQEIAAEVVKLGQRPEGVVYAVPGHPLVGETTVTHILALAKTQQVAVQLIDGLSFLEPTLTALGLDALDGLQIQDAVNIAALHHPPLNPDVPAVIAQVYSLAVASNVKLTLANQYPDEHPIVLLHAVGTPDETLESIALYELDRSDKVDHLTSLYVPPLPAAGSFERFQETIAHLRAPEGCPWDRKQTHQSLREYLLEETYEVLEALDNDDPDSLREELGDLLLQIVLHSQIAVESAEFSMADVIAAVNTKMIQRHPHVWGDVHVENADQVVSNWEEIKQREKAARGESAPNKSILDGVAQALPALAQAEKYQSRAAHVGFDWPQIEGAIGKLSEELNELQAAQTDEGRADELGDVLFSLVNVARWYKIDPEVALRQTNRKFARRFKYIEEHAGRDLKELSLDEMDMLWNAAKAIERDGAAK